MLLFATGPARAIGFTGSFAPNTWVVINTNPSQTLTGTNGVCGNGNTYGCVIDVNDTDVTILGTQPQDPDPPLLGENNTTTFNLNNSNWRPYVISFNWSFTNVGSTQIPSFLVNPGALYIDGVDQGYAWDGTDDSYPTTSATVYLPPGATLSFIVATDNNVDAPSLYITGFDAVEIPAPLPLAGASTAFFWSGRLRRRIRNAPAAPAGLAPMPSLNSPPAPAGLRQPASLKQSRAMQDYARRIGLPLPLGAD